MKYIESNQTNVCEWSPWSKYLAIGFPCQQYHKFEEFSTSAFSPNSIASGMQNSNGIRKKNCIPFTCEPFGNHFIRFKHHNIQWSFEIVRSHTNVRIWKTCAKWPAVVINTLVLLQKKPLVLNWHIIGEWQRSEIEKFIQCDQMRCVVLFG